MQTIFKLLGASAALALLGFGLLVNLALGAAGAAQNGGDGMCHAPLPDLTQTVRASESHTPTATRSATATATPGAENPCFSRSRFGAQVVAWAKKMADALTVAPSCGARRT